MGEILDSAINVTELVVDVTVLATTGVSSSRLADNLGDIAKDYAYPVCESWY